MQCRMTGCQKVATETWRLVDVCCHCKDDLQAEQQMFYAGRLLESDRILKYQIDKIKESEVKQVIGTVVRKYRGIITQVDIDGRRYHLVKEAAK